jgi:hypothetical protein
MLSSATNGQDRRIRFAEAQRAFNDLENLCWSDDIPPHLMYYTGGLISRIRLEELDPEAPNRMAKLRDAHTSLYELLECATETYPRSHLQGIRQRILEMMVWIEREVVTADEAEAISLQERPAQEWSAAPRRIAATRR